MLNCPSVAAGFKKYDIFLSAEKYPMETIPDVFSDWVIFYKKPKHSAKE